MRLSKRRIAIFAAQIASVGVFVLVWQLLAEYNIVSSLLVAPPSAVFPRFWATLHMVRGNINVPFSFEQSLGVTVLAVAAAVSAGVVLGIIIGNIKFLHDVLDEYIIAIYALPKLTLLPLFWILFGLTITYRLAFASLDAAFAVLIIMTYTVGSVDPALMKMARAVGASRRQTIFKVFFPSVIPSLLASVRIAFVACFAGVVVAELFVGNSGIGYVVSTFTANFEVADLYAVILALVIISVAVNFSLLAIERYLMRWKTMSPS